MNTIITISLRNLFRQKRRNLLLGTAIAFGMMILVIANAFAHGISDTIFNKIVVYVAGHASVGFAEKGDYMRQVFRDGPRMKEAVKKAAPEIRVMQESIGAFVRAIGNNKTDNLVLVGIDRSVSENDPEMRKQDEEAFHVIDGKFDDIGRTDLENPVLVSVQKAKSLNVKKGDYIRIRFRDVNGHDVAHRLTIVGIFKSGNVFMQMPMFADIATTKRVMGYSPWETANLQMRMSDAKKMAPIVADHIQEALKPGIAQFVVSLTKKSAAAGATTASVFALRTDSLGKAVSRSALTITAGDTAKARSKSAVIVTHTLAQTLGAAPGDTLEFTYTGKYEPQLYPARVIVNAVCADVAGLSGPVLLLNERDFYTEYNEVLPVDPKTAPAALTPDNSCALLPAIGTEWILLDRTRNSTDMEGQMRKMGQKQYKATTVSVASMYEMASNVLQMEGALNLITLVAVLVLFFIIIIGVINTLRMTIRERTREIGTIRAIGMQQNDVRNSFILETTFLALFSSIAGIVAAFGIMTGLQFYRFPEGDNPLAMLLVDQKLRFLPDPLAIVFFLILIVAIAVLTAWFPARRAAKLSAAEALRHYE